MQVSERRNIDFFSQLDYGIGIGSPTVVSECYSELKKKLDDDCLSESIRSQSKTFPHAAHFIPRLLQINKIDSQKTGLGDREKVCLALFIENIIHGKKRTSSEYFKKTDFLSSLSRPPRSLQYNSDDKAAYIVLKTHQNKILEASGGSKKVTGAVRVPTDTFFDPVIVAQSVNKDSIDPSELIDEFKIHKKFSKNRGIWPIFGYTTYKKSLSEKSSVQKVSSMSPMAISVREMRQKGLLSVDDLFDLVDDVAHGVDCLHRAGYIHGDINMRNILFSFSPKQGVIAGLIDFGRSFKVNDEQALPFPFDQGYYGSVYPTAPELFGDKNFTGDIFKTEIWALGYLLYQIFFEDNPSWKGLLMDQYSILEEELPKGIKEDMIGEVEDLIEEPRKELLKMEDRDRYNEIDLLIYDMMRSDPDLRPDSQEIIKRMAKIRKLPLP